MWVNMMFLIEMTLTGIAMSVFCSSCLTPKYSQGKTFLTGCILFTALNVILVPTEVTPLRSVITTMVVVAYSHIFFADKKSVKSLTALLEFAALNLSDMIMIWIWCVCDMENMIAYGDTAISKERVLLTWGAVVILWGVSGLFIFIRNRGKITESRATNFSLIFSCLVIQNFLGICLIRPMFNVLDKLFGNIVLLESLFIILEIVLLYYVMFAMRKKELVIEEMKMMEEKVELNAKFYKESLKQYQWTKELRHDAKNYLQALEYLMETDRKEAGRLIETLEKRIMDETM